MLRFERVRLRGYALAVGACVVALLPTDWQREHLTRVVFMLFWPAVLVSAWFGGRARRTAPVSGWRSAALSRARWAAISR